MADTNIPEPSGTGTRDTATWLVGGITIFVASLTAIGTATGQVARSFRNNDTLTGAAIILVLVAVGAGVGSQLVESAKRKKHLLAVGVLAALAGLALGMWPQVSTLHLTDRPTIEASFSHPTSGPVLEIKAKMSQAQAHDQLLVSARGVPIGQSQSRTLYYVKTGPTSDGDLAQNAQIDFDSAKFTNLRIVAVGYSLTDLAPEIDCDGNVLDRTGATTAMKIENRESVSCVTMDFSGDQAPDVQTQP